MNSGNLMPRDVAPDVLRGFALLGILVVNIPFMALNSQDGAHGTWVQGMANGSAGFIMLSLFAGKFYILFSFLFGYSASYIIKDDRANRPRWAKRSLALLGLGVLHFSFLWHGDILFLYGLMGLMLIPFLFRTEKTLKIWIRIIFILFSTILIIACTSFIVGERLFPDEFKEQFSAQSRLDEVMLGGTFLESVMPRIELWVFGLIGGIFLQGGFVFAAFLLGLKAGRRKVLSGSFENLNLSRMLKLGLILGLPMQITAATIFVRNEQLESPSEAIYFASVAAAFISAPLLTMAYVALILRMIKRSPSLVAWLRPAGKMSLTLYISQSLIASLIFAPWGLGLFQEVDLWGVMLIAVAIWLFLVLVATNVLKKYKQGPIEAVVHRLTASKLT